MSRYTADPDAPLLTARETCQVLLQHEPWASDAVPFSPATLRGWRSKGLLPDHGHDGWGRALYSLPEVAALALARRPRPSPARHA